MNYDNKNTDKKLQELENQSLPDLSKMDDHWREMSLMLQTSTTQVRPSKNLFKNKIVLVIVSVVLVLVSLFFILRLNTHKEGDVESSYQTPVTNTNPVTDSASGAVNYGKDTSAAIRSSDTAILNVEKKEEIPVATNPKLLLEKLYLQLQKKSQEFFINNKKDTIIYGKEGTVLTVPANAFNTKSDVIVYLTEFYSLNDMINNKLTTTCDGRQLITGGMVYIDARDKDDQLIELKNGAHLRLEMPKPGNATQMELFYGDDRYRNETTTVLDSINWMRTNQPFGAASGGIYDIQLLSKKEKMTDGYDTIPTDKKAWNYGLDYYLSDTIDMKKINKKADSVSIARYGVNINRMGWINCDKFLNDPRPRVDLIVDLKDNPSNYHTLLVFEKFASIMPISSTTGNTIRFANLPEGEPASIVSFGIKNDKSYTARMKLVISRSTIHDLTFEELTGTAMKKSTSK